MEKLNRVTFDYSGVICKGTLHIAEKCADKNYTAESAFDEFTGRIHPDATGAMSVTFIESDDDGKIVATA